MNILITGGCGYIGSHTAIELLNSGHDIVIVDNFYNSSRKVIPIIKKLSNRDFLFYEGDVCNYEFLDNIFSNNTIDAVIHFAGYKAVGESVSEPLKYYHNNLLSLVNLCNVMSKYNVKNIIFSSSATTYGDLPCVDGGYYEEMKSGNITNPYARSKYFIEFILNDLFTSDNKWRITILRYFNPTGAHKSGEIGEDPCGIPNNLLPYVSQVAVGRLPEIRVFGNDYNTKDGTGERDYIHVVDLAKGHIAALNKSFESPGVRLYNLGNGKPYSVLDIIHTYEKVCGKKLNYVFTDRRPGDLDRSFANPNKAKAELNWEAELSLNEMCEDNWRWQSKHPYGFK